MSPSLTALQGGMGPSSPKSEDTQRGSAKSVADILAAAADLIEPEGRWVQGASCVGPHGDCYGWSVVPDFQCACALGALAAAQGLKCTMDAAVSPAGKALSGLIGGRVDEWNDAKGRTQAEVVGTIRAAAEKARAGA